MPNKKLKTAMAEIKTILEKHDIAGSVVLHTPGHGEFLNHFATSYSGISLNENRLRFRVRKEDYNGDATKRNQVLRDSVNMVSILSEIAGKNALMLMDISNILDKETGAIHTGLTSDE